MALELNALGMIEFTCIGKGVESSDQMVKAADVIPLFFRTICPGKFLSAIHGNIAAVNAALEAGRITGGACVVDSFSLAYVHPDVIRALSGMECPEELNALGIIETYSAASAVLAADAAAKAASVTLLDIRTAMGLGGKGIVFMTGDVAAVQASVSSGARLAGDSGLLISEIVIPRPARHLWDQIL